MLSSVSPSTAHRGSDESAKPPWPPALLGTSPLVRRVRDHVRRAALADRALIVAEAGLDAEAIACAVHRRGSPPSAPFVVVNCTRGDQAALDITLFGHAGGRPTRQPARLEVIGPDAALVAASGGTLYLANVIDLPASTQARLARLVRDGEARVGGVNSNGGVVRIRVRLLAGTEPPIDAEVQQGSFRADLYRRLSAVRIDVPPLRERPEDIPIIARHLLEVAATSRDRERSLTRAALALIVALPWTGNVGELADVLERVSAPASGAVRVEDVLAQVGPEWRAAPSAGASLREARRQFEREYIAAVLRQHDWRMSDAARALGIQRTNLYRKARQLNIPHVRVTRSSRA